jgi:chaperonin GroES
MDDGYSTDDGELNQRVKLRLEDIVKAPNLCDLLDDDTLKAIGNFAQQGYMIDLASREAWESQQAEANKLALQVVEEKTYPWVGCANVKFPLITVAALQYHARAFPTLISGTEVAHARVIGLDPDGSKTARAERISTHMSWQCLEQDEAWEEEHDKALLVQPICGCAFIKHAFDQEKGYVTDRLVLPKDFVINYWTKDIRTSPRYTHVFPLTHNKIRQRQLDGRFKKWDDGEAAPQPSMSQDTGALKEAQDQRQGMQEPAQEAKVTPYLTGEMYCWWDFDGDGYQEPYIVTFDIESSRVWRIVARFNSTNIRKTPRGEVYNIEPLQVFSKIPFIPSPDGGFYDLGLGVLEGPLNESVNTAINQIFDAGTMSTLGGGFVGRGFKSKGGPFTFRPNEWHPTDAPGDDLRKNILPLPVREPSNVLFQLIGFLVQYGERIVSATEIQVGESPGANQKAETTRILNENGARVYTAIYKRTWRAMRDGFRIRYDLNASFLEADIDYTNLTTGKGAMISVQDYRGDKIYVVPAADPTVMSQSAAAEQASMLVRNAMTLPGHNKYKAILRAYKLQKIPNIDEIMPPPKGPDPKDPQKQIELPDFPPQPNVKMLEVQVKQKLQELKEKEFQAERQDTEIEMQVRILKEMAEIDELHAKAQKELSEAEGINTGHAIALINTEIAARKHGLDHMLGMLSLFKKKGASSGNGSQPIPAGAGVGSVEASKPDASVPASNPPVH